MRVLLTRPRAQALEMARELSQRGHEAIVSPLLERELVEPADDLAEAGALVFTSMNGVSAIEHRIPGDCLARPVFAVSERTAQEARKAGFERVIVGPGRAERLLPLIMDFGEEFNGPVLHISGEDVRTDVAALLGGKGHEARRVTVYRMIPEKGLSREAIDALRGGRIEAALFFSPRSADIFVKVVEATSLGEAARSVVAVALSAPVAEPLRRLEWLEIRIADHADRNAMYKALEQKTGRTRRRG